MSLPSPGKCAPLVESAQNSKANGDGQTAGFYPRRRSVQLPQSRGSGFTEDSLENGHFLTVQLSRGANL